MSRAMKLNSIVALAVTLCMPHLLHADEDNDEANILGCDVLDGDYTLHEGGDWSCDVAGYGIFNGSASGQDGFWACESEQCEKDWPSIDHPDDEDYPNVHDAPTADQLQDQPEDTTPPYLLQEVDSHKCDAAQGAEWLCCVDGGDYAPAKGGDLASCCYPPPKNDCVFLLGDEAILDGDDPDDEDYPNVHDAPTADQLQDQPEDTTPPWWNDAVESLEGFGTLELLGTPVAELDPKVALPIIETMIDPDLIKACLGHYDYDGEHDGYIVQQDGRLLCCLDEWGCVGRIDGETEVQCDVQQCWDDVAPYLESGHIILLQPEAAAEELVLNDDTDATFASGDEDINGSQDEMSTDGNGLSSTSSVCGIGSSMMMTMMLIGMIGCRGIARRRRSRLIMHD